MGKIKILRQKNRIRQIENRGGGNDRKFSNSREFLALRYNEKKQNRNGHKSYSLACFDLYNRIRSTATSDDREKYRNGPE